MGRTQGDWDFATRAPPEEVRRLFRRTVPIGIEHGTVGVLARDGHHVRGHHVPQGCRDGRAPRRGQLRGDHRGRPRAQGLHDQCGWRGTRCVRSCWIRSMDTGPTSTPGRPADCKARPKTGSGRITSHPEGVAVRRALRFDDRGGATWQALCSLVDHLTALSAEAGTRGAAEDPRGRPGARPVARPIRPLGDAAGACIRSSTRFESWTPVGGGRRPMVALGCDCDGAAGRPALTCAWPRSSGSCSPRTPPGFYCGSGSPMRRWMRRGFASEPSPFRRPRGTTWSSAGG